MKRIFMAMLGLLVATHVFAQSEVQQQPAIPAFLNIDPNAKLTKEQLQTIMPPLAAHFDEIDTNDQGYVTPQQIQQFLSKRAPKLPSPPQFPPRFP